MTLYVPILVAVDTDDQEEAHSCAAVVASSVTGESFRLVTTDPDTPALREAPDEHAVTYFKDYEVAT